MVNLIGASRLIEEYSNQQNRWLNTQLNLHFLEIGKRINSYFSQNKVPVGNRKLFIRNVSRELQKQYGKCFAEKQLCHMAEFASQSADWLISLRLGYLATWEHIILLLPLAEKEEQLFYAGLVARTGMSPAKLRRQIANQMYQQTSGSKKKEQDIIELIKDSKIEVASGDGTVTNFFIDAADETNIRSVNYNIFKNEYFINFITSC
jgi:hypothetical protein